MLSMQWTEFYFYFFSYFVPQISPIYLAGYQDGSKMAFKLDNQCIIESSMSITRANQTWPYCPPVQSVHKRWQTQLLHFTDTSCLGPHDGQTAAPSAFTSSMIKTLFARWKVQMKTSSYRHTSHPESWLCSNFCSNNFGDIKISFDLLNNSWLKIRPFWNII